MGLKVIYVSRDSIGLGKMAVHQPTEQLTGLNNSNLNVFDADV